MSAPHKVYVYFTDFFNVDPDDLEAHGALNISILADLPLFIDPFLLFHSTKESYQKLHDEMIRYLLFLCKESRGGEVPEGLIDSWYRFPEVKETWLGFSKSGNSGRGLGRVFARALNDNFNAVLPGFGSERITKSPHLEKLCLIAEGVGRDMISDFTTNLIKGFLCEYTEAFARAHIHPTRLSTFAVDHAAFNYETRAWETRRYTLPRFCDSFVLLTPKDILSKDDTWINKEDLWHLFPDIPMAIPDHQLRAQIDVYFRSKLPKESDSKKGPTQKERIQAMRLTALKFPEIYDRYIKIKEDSGDEAQSIKSDEVIEVQTVFIEQARELIDKLAELTAFYESRPTTLEDTRQRVAYLKQVVENNGGWRLFWLKGKPFRRETDAQILFRLTWRGSPHNVSREVNDGLGPVDFKISHGADDITIADVKFASNTKLRRNLLKQLDTYKRASESDHEVMPIMYFTHEEEVKVKGLLKELGLDSDPNTILIDARADNKIPGSRA